MPFELTERKLSARDTSQTEKQDNIILSEFKHGLNTADPPFQLAPTELAKLLNWKYKEGGRLVTREPLSQYTNSVISGSVKEFKNVPIGGTTYELLVGSDFKLYYLDGSLDPQLIGTLEGEAEIIAFNGVAVILDGSYTKYLDSVADIKIAYDGGTGSTGYQFNNRTGDNDTSLALGNGTNIRVGTKFTSQAWTAGYTIPPTTVYAKLLRELNGFAGVDNVDILVRLRKVSDDSVIAEKTFVEAPIATNVDDAAATEYSVTFDSGDITAELIPNTAYYASLEYANGDATNYVHVRCSTVAAGGTGYHYIAAWSADVTYTPIMGLRPGMPPKGAFGRTHDQSIFISGHPDNPGYVYVGQNHLDYSTSGQGGYIGAVDADANNFPVGGIEVLYNDLYVFGKESQPYLCKLSGTSMTDYALPLLFQRAWTTHKVVKSTVNDMWFASAAGADALTGVEQYGDIRTKSASDPVKDRFINYWDTDDTIAGYNPKDGQYWLVFPGYHRILVAHTSIGVLGPDGEFKRFPWTEYEFYRNIFTPLEVTSDYATRTYETDYVWVRSRSGTNEWLLSYGANEDYTIYTELDKFGTIGVAANLITIVGTSNVEDGYVYYDAGLNWFDDDFTFDLDINISGGDPTSEFNIWAISNMVGSEEGIIVAAENALCVGMYKDAVDGWLLNVKEIIAGAATSVDAVNAFTEGTDYYLTIRRVEGDTSYLYCDIYSDSDRETLIETVEIALSADINFRYLYAFMTRGSGGFQSFSALLGPLDARYEMPYDPTIDTEPDFITMDDDVLSEGTMGSLADHETDYGDNDVLGYDTIYIRDQTGNPSTSGVVIRSIIQPTCFEAHDGEFFVGGSDGYVYKLNDSIYKDLDEYRIVFDFRTAYMEAPFKHVNIIKEQIDAASEGGGLLSVSIYRDDVQGAPIVTKNYLLAKDDRLTVGDMAGVDLEDVFDTVDPSSYPLWKRVNLNARNFQVQIGNVWLSGFPFHVKGLMIQYRHLGH